MWYKENISLNDISQSTVQTDTNHHGKTSKNANTNS